MIYGLEGYPPAMPRPRPSARSLGVDTANVGSKDITPLMLVLGASLVVAGYVMLRDERRLPPGRSRR
jgi:hypothetical protein